MATEKDNSLFPPWPVMKPKDPEGILHTASGDFTQREVFDFRGIVSGWRSDPSSLGSNGLREAMEVAQHSGMAARFRAWLKTANLPLSTYIVLCDEYNDDGSTVAR